MLRVLAGLIFTLGTMLLSGGSPHKKARANHKRKDDNDDYFA